MDEKINPKIARMQQITWMCISLKSLFVSHLSRSNRSFSVRLAYPVISMTMNVIKNMERCQRFCDLKLSNLVEFFF